jgi:hypothetical protein
VKKLTLVGLLLVGLAIGQDARGLAARECACGPDCACKVAASALSAGVSAGATAAASAVGASTTRAQTVGSLRRLVAVCDGLVCRVLSVPDVALQPRVTQAAVPVAPPAPTVQVAPPAAPATTLATIPLVTTIDCPTCPNFGSYGAYGSYGSYSYAGPWSSPYGYSGAPYASGCYGSYNALGSYGSYGGVGYGLRSRGRLVERFRAGGLCGR